MKFTTKFVFAVAAVASCMAAVAQTSQADMDRRARNRDEALAAYHRNGTSGSQSMSNDSSSNGTLRERTHRDADKVRATTHKSAQSTRRFTHRQLQSVRKFGARQDAKFSKKGTTVESDKAPAAIGK